MPVHIMAVLGTARQVCGVYTTLKSFVEDEMATFLRDMGERQFDAAVQHLENGTRTPAMMSDYALLAIGDLENAYRTFEASAPRGFRLRIRSALGPYAMEERATAYEKACATVLLQSMCYKYRKDENNAKLYIDKAGQFFEMYAEARATVLFNKEKGKALEYFSEKHGPLVQKGKMPSDDEIRAPINRAINAERKQLEALSG
jgi:hypothetical protein